MLRARCRNWGRLTLCALMLLLVVPAATSASARKPAKPKPVPPGFVGMVIDGPLYPVTEPPLDMATQLDSMVATGVETMRATFDWATAQPYQNFSQVPDTDLEPVHRRRRRADELHAAGSVRGARGAAADHDPPDRPGRAQVGPRPATAAA